MVIDLGEALLLDQVLAVGEALGVEVEGGEEGGAFLKVKASAGYVLFNCNPRFLSTLNFLGQTMSV